MDEDADTTLPDLHTVPDPSLPTDYSGSKSGNKECPPNLISPPAVLRYTDPPVRSSIPKRTNLGDLLCTLNFDVIPSEDTTHSTAPTASRKVVTPTPHKDSSTKTPTNKSQPVHDNLSPLAVPTPMSRKVVTPTPHKDSSTMTPTNKSQPVHGNSSPLAVPTHTVVTSFTADPATPSNMPVPITISDENSSPAINSPRIDVSPRKVVTPTLVPSTDIDEIAKTPIRLIPVAREDAEHGTEASHNTPRDDTLNAEV